jgi:simple sugar transport system ATP-binding protein
MIELKGICKFFPSNGIQALDGANFTLLPGEIHALVGENGAGKSTLMQIMAGYLSPSSGSIFVEGKERLFKTPADALGAGIGMVRQHPRQVPGFKVWENCVLGAEKSRARVREVSEKWGFDLPLDMATEDLTISQRQKAAILSLILRDVRCLIFDEPTAVLLPDETRSLFQLFTRLRDEGCGIVLISHKLDETLAVSDRLTVIRRGQTREAGQAASLSPGELETLIFGTITNQTASGPVVLSESGAAGSPELPGKKFREETVLSVRDLSVQEPGRPFIRNISFEIKRGKIIGIAGIRESGLETLETALTGFAGNSRSKTLRGTILLNGRPVTDVRSFREEGGAYLGADRLGKNLASGLPLRESLIIHAHRRSRRGKFGLGTIGIMDGNFLDGFCEKILARAGIKRRSENRADSFSGGMLQRVLLAREFAEDASLVVLAEPGWGLDLQNREKMISRLRAQADEGRAVLLFSTDVDELLLIADEIFVLRNGNFSAHFPLDGKKDRSKKIEEIRRAMVSSGNSCLGKGDFENNVP